MSNILAIAFDCFGTLVEVASPAGPYGALARALGDAERRRFRRDVMTRPLSLTDAARTFRLPVGDDELNALNTALEQELGSIVCFPETLEVLQELKARGLQLALCSNLAQPYASPVRQLLGPLLDEYIWSFEVGAIKPEAAIYQNLCDRMGLAPSEILMVGDSATADYGGARAAGLQARHLVRESLGKPEEHQMTTLRGVLGLLPTT